ncbi:hypothetical protein RRG08_046918 [Elysia crispata]|uniref:Uncharacterized protein n=1 Tax=Elysia crispata TaxID=231223 RepID=A0AAE1DHN2_9GAST|nr:hypothetical protein RRG08_046918 [Elysia crispata]
MTSERGVTDGLVNDADTGVLLPSPIISVSPPSVYPRLVTEAKVPSRCGRVNAVCFSLRCGGRGVMTFKSLNTQPAGQASRAFVASTGLAVFI